METRLREGIWRMIQRVHKGIPGFVGSGEVQEEYSQFTGGLAGVRTAWLVKPYGMGLIDAVPVAGFYLFGMYWPNMFEQAGLRGNFSKILGKLGKEFGWALESDLARGTVDFQPVRPPPCPPVSRMMRR